MFKLKIKLFFLSLVNIFILTFFLAIASFAEVYSIPGDSDIKFQYKVGFAVFEGNFKIKDSIFNLNKNKPAASQFHLSFDLNRSSAGFFIATKAMLSKPVLYAKKYPEIAFKSRSMSLLGEQFEIYGDLTIRGVTRGINLIVTPLGFDPENLEYPKELEFQISAEIKRDEFGAVGYSGLVGNIIKLHETITLFPTFSSNE